jgi:hypothetical protein
VHLEGGYSTANPGSRVYADVTDEPDAQFEASVAAARTAILENHRAELAQYVHFPLVVYRTPHAKLTIYNAAELAAHWDQLFPPAYVAALRGTVPHEMFVRNGMAALGSGLLWFDSKGLAELNPPV